MITSLNTFSCLKAVTVKYKLLVLISPRQVLLGVDNFLLTPCNNTELPEMSETAQGFAPMELGFLGGGKQTTGGQDNCDGDVVKSNMTEMGGRLLCRKSQRVDEKFQPREDSLQHIRE